MATTPYLRLQKPPFDTIPWDEAINGNMDTIDAFISQFMMIPNYVGAWANNTSYVAGQATLDSANATIYQAQTTHTSSPTPTTFAQERTTFPSRWTVLGSAVGNASIITIADASPVSPKTGDLWFDSVGTQLYVRYNDGNSQQWVTTNNQPIAPIIDTGTNNVGRNLVHNSMFNVCQRGFGPWTTAVYNADRWTNQFSSTGGSCIVTVAAFTASTAAAALSDEGARFAVQYVHTAGSGTSDYAILTQRIEGVRRLSGKTITLSFWAWTAAGNRNLGIELAQQFGIGGSQSPNVYGIGVQNVAITPTATRYSVTITMPSAAGKTFGTTDDTGYVEVNFWVSGGSTFSPARCLTGLQSGTFFFWGVQLEIAQPGQTQPTPLEKPDPELQLRQCQRFYQVGLIQMNASASGGSQAFVATNMLPVPMRGTPMFAVNGSLTLVNATAPAPFATSNSVIVYLNFASIAVGAVACVGPYTASADL